MSDAGTIEQDESRHFVESDRTEPISVETHEVRYLDLSGDGVPDAVEHISRRAYRSRGSDVVDTIEEARRLEYGIGVDGRPSGVSERTQVVSLDAASRAWTSQN